jgi:hypothetical protein
VSDPPQGLKAAGRQLWGDTLAGVQSSWKLDVKDLALLEEAARLRDVAARLQRRVDREGTTVAGSEDQLVAHPLLRELRLTRALIVSTMAKIEVSRPRTRTAHLDKSGRDQLRDARSRRWS